MKNKKIQYKISAALAVSLGVILSGTYSPVFAADTPDYKAMEEYSSYEPIIVDEMGYVQGLGSYALYDIDQDGVRELIISAGTCEADWYNNIYTLEDGLVTMIGTLERNSGFYAAPDGNGIYSVFGKQGYQEVQRITKKGNELVEETIESRELGENEAYYTNDDPIELVEFSAGNSAGPAIYNVEVTAPDGGVNMRSGAGVEYDKVLPDMIPNGTVLCITQQATASNGNSWGYTSYNGVYGWIALTQVTSLEPTEGSPIPHTRYVINCNESITLRTNPDVNAAEICQIPLGTAVDTFGDAGNGFISVYYQGSSGYCLADYLSDPVD